MLVSSKNKVTLKEKLHIVFGIIIMTWNISSCQSISKHTFERFQMIVIVEGVVNSNTHNGTDCKVNYNSRTGIYNLEYLDINGQKVFQIFKEVENTKNDKIKVVQFIGDDSPVGVKYRVIDKIDSDKLIEFRSLKSPDPNKNVQIIFRYDNNSG